MNANTTKNETTLCNVVLNNLKESIDGNLNEELFSFFYAKEKLSFWKKIINFIKSD